MNANVSLEQRITAWMAEEVSVGASDSNLDDILATTRRIRPEPAWLVLLKEPPMRLNARVAVGSPTRRLTAMLAILLLLVGLLAVAAGAMLGRQPGPSADWPMFRGDSTRSGLVANGPIGHPVLAWQYQAGTGVNQDVAIVGGLVYVADERGVLHALDLQTGAERWRVKLTAPLTGPSVSNGIVVLADGTGTIHAVDASTGQARWQSADPYPGPSSATIGDGRAYLGTGDGRLVALDLRTGTRLWNAVVSSAGGQVEAPAFANGSVYAGSLRGGLVAVDAATGVDRWRFDTGTDQTGTAVVADGIAYIGSAAEAGPVGHLWALDSSTGAVKWRIDRTFQAPAVAGGVAYTADADGVVAAVDTATGRIQWQAKLGGTVRAPAVSGGVVYVAADTMRRVFALAAVNGGQLWQFDVDGPDTCCIAVAHGSVFEATEAGSVYNISGDGATLTPGPAPTSQAATRSPTPSAAGPTATPGPPVAIVRWHAAPPSGSFMPNGVVLDPVTHQLWVADPNNDRFVIFKPDGSFVETWGISGTGDGQFALQRSNGDGYGAIAFEKNGAFFVLDVGNRRIQAFDANRRFVKAWGTFGMGPGQYNDPVGIAVSPDGTLAVLDDVRGVIERYDSDGRVIGSFPAFPNATSGFNAANSLAVDSRGHLYVSDINPGQVDEFDASGTLLMTFGSHGAGPGQFGDQPGSMAIDAAGRVFVDQGAGRRDGPAILVFDPAGRYLVGFGTAGPGPVQLVWPTGLWLDGQGHLVVGDAAGQQDQSLTSSLVGLDLLPPIAR